MHAPRHRTHSPVRRAALQRKAIADSRNRAKPTKTLKRREFDKHLKKLHAELVKLQF